MSFTKSNGSPAARIYERLRSRSRRRWWQPSRSVHRAYVRGVYDALTAVEEELVILGSDHFSAHLSRFDLFGPRR